MGHCSGPFKIASDVDVNAIISASKTLLPLIGSVHGVSTKDVLKLRNIIKEPWWPSSLSFEIGKIPPDLLKDQTIPEILQFPDKVCGIELAVFILSEVDAADKRAVIREEAYNKYNKKNLYFVITDHVQVRDRLTTRRVSGNTWTSYEQTVDP